MKNAFTLIELSIVLIIIGLLVGGILAGRTLVEVAENRQINTEWEEYKRASNVYFLKYDAIAGDHDNATAFFPTAAGNGDNSRFVENIDVNDESWLFFQHLALAELIEGTYTGADGPGGNRDAVIDENTPAGPIDGSGWSIYYNPTGIYGVTPHYHQLVLGADTPNGGINFSTFGALFRTDFVEQFDQKYDDNVASTGTVRIHAAYSDGGTSSLPNHVYDTNPASLIAMMLELRLVR